MRIQKSWNSVETRWHQTSRGDIDSGKAVSGLKPVRTYVMKVKITSDSVEPRLIRTRRGEIDPGKAEDDISMYVNMTFAVQGPLPPRGDSYLL